ncbi:DUF2624 domain-containing protein [Bacillus spongiae]|uniref:DUF2624 domain-containing protein n=1 Tax=Bacillus spongiae TaxID=2683610 RepID=A0ABU8H964_9BACI
MKLIQHVINQKMNRISGEELLKYAKQYSVKLSIKEANQIAQYLRGKNYDVFDDQQRSHIIKQLAKISGPKTAREVNRLFLQFTDS